MTVTDNNGDDDGKRTAAAAAAETTRNKSITSKAMQYRQDIVTRIIMLLYATGVNYNGSSNYTKYLAQLCCRCFFCVLENFRHKFANLVAPRTDGTMKPLVRCKAHPVV